MDLLRRPRVPRRQINESTICIKHLSNNKLAGWRPATPAQISRKIRITNTPKIINQAPFDGNNINRIYYAAKIAYKWHTTQQYQFKANRTEVTEYLYNPLEIKTTASDGTKRRACHNR